MHIRHFRASIRALERQNICKSDTAQVAMYELGNVAFHVRVV
jgi:hypothetical protein